jgi:hypothetical protein
MNLTQASQQWATRPADQRFWTLDEMMAATTESRTNSHENQLTVRDTHAVPIGERGVALEVGGHAGDEVEDKYGDRRCSFSNWSFGQLCRMIGAPASYLRGLTGELAADCVNEGLREWNQANDGPRHSLIHMNGSPQLRAMTSDRYVRVWNNEIVGRLGQLHAQGWRVPPARPASGDVRTRIATEDDVLNFGTRSALTVEVGDTIAPAGLYASDHDMFAFLVNPEAVVDNGLSPAGMRRGTMIRQSEVGECSIWKLDFLFDTVCGNHIVWGATDVSETRIRHTGNSVHEQWQATVAEISAYADSGAGEQEAKIRQAQTTLLGNDRDEVVDFLFGKRLLAKRTARQAFDLASDYSDVHGDPRSAWGLVSGLTRLSQEAEFADKRTDLDITAGKILAKVTA